MIRGSSGDLLLDTVEGSLDGGWKKTESREPNLGKTWFDNIEHWLGLLGVSNREIKKLEMNRELLRTTTEERQLETLDIDDATEC